MALVEIDALSYSYAGEGERKAVDGCSLAVERGESVLLVGPSGCGKSTLLRAVTGLVPHFYGGWMSGSLRLDGRSLRGTKPAQLARLVGCVFQDPEAQVVTSTVLNEVTFALENVGTDPSRMRLLAAEALSALGAAELRERSTRELSGGELQRVALAAAIAPQPPLLVLDEPTSQLDPAAAESLFALLRRLNEDAGIAVLMAEHRLERCYHWVDRVIVMEAGRILRDAPPADVAAWAVEHASPFVPSVPRIFAGLTLEPLPLTVREGAALARKLAVAPPSPRTSALTRNARAAAPAAIELDSVTHVYRSGVEAVSECTLSIAEGESVALLGANGAGKSTLVRHVNGLLRPSRGRVRVQGRDIVRTATEDLAGTVAFLGQNPNDYLFSPTVAEELRFTLRNVRPECTDHHESMLAETLATLGIERYADHEPRTLSAGERQRVALASVLCGGASIVVLDEPTRGMDRLNKEALGETLRALQASGKTVVVVTHDVDFAAEFSDRAVVLDAGRIVADGSAADVLTSTIFLAPQAHCVMRDVDPSVTTVAEARAACRRAESA